MFCRVKHVSRICLALAVISVGTSVAAFDAIWWTRLGRRSIGYCVSNDEIDKMPGWGVESDNPPVSARRAICIAREFTRRLNLAKKIDFADSGEPQLYEAALQPLGKNKWVWIIRFDIAGGTGAGGGMFDTFDVVVLQNAKVAKWKLVKNKTFDQPRTDSRNR